MELDDIWGWIAPVIVWASDYYCVLFAVVLFCMQMAYQTIRIKQALKTKD